MGGNKDQSKNMKIKQRKKESDKVKYNEKENDGTHGRK